MRKCGLKASDRDEWGKLVDEVQDPTLRSVAPSSKYHIVRTIQYTATLKKLRFLSNASNNRNRST